MLSVLEMPNLYPHSVVRADYVIADSLFVLKHPSLRGLFAPLSFPGPLFSGQSHLEEHAHHVVTSPPAVGVVISPGVDMARRKSLALQSPVRGCACFASGQCKHLNETNLNGTAFSRDSRLEWRCGASGPFVIGIVCRLSPEKAVGLFLLAAHTLVHNMNCTKCRFVVIGDGPLRSDLEELAFRLHISTHIRFLGWVAKDHLPAYLVNWDVAVTTGAWRETFSMVGTDHMALGIPLVTFAAGGMGEYVDDPYLSDQGAVFSFVESNSYARQYLRNRASSTNENTGSDKMDGNPFMISRNAVVVIEPNSDALALALLFMQSNDAVRSSVGYFGQLTVQEHFSPQKSLSAYMDLFSGMFLQ